MLERIVSPVSNLVTFVAICVILVGAVLKVRRSRSLASVLQLVGAGGIVVGTVASICAQGLLSGVALGIHVGPERRDLAATLWYGASLVIAMGFVCFAWGYVTGETDQVPVEPGVLSHGKG